MSKRKMGISILLVFLLCAVMSVTAFAARKKGWVQEGEKWYYYNDKGQKQKGWLELGGKRYYLRKTTGERATGTFQLGGVFYSFNSKGVLVKVLKNAGWKQDSTGRWFDNGNGTYPKSCWKSIQGKRYRFDSRGYVVTGWKKIKKAWYYFNEKGVMVTEKWVKSKKSYYYLGADGKMKTNAWIGERYVNEKGFWIKGYRDDTRNSKKKTGWVGYGSSWRYFKKGKAVTGWQQIRDTKGKKHWYYFKKNTYMQTGFFFDGKDYYFLDTRPDKIGIMATGWLKINGKAYYFFPSNGKMARNSTYTAGGKEYRFDKNGVCLNFDD